MNKSVVFLGNFLEKQGSQTSVSQEVGELLKQAGWKIYSASNQRNHFLRMVDFLWVILLQRKRYALAHIDVFSGPAFCLVEAKTALLKLLKKPYVLTLRGGNLPDFFISNRWRAGRLFKSAYFVTAPSSYLLKNLQPVREDIFIIPNGISIRFYPYRSRQTVAPKLAWLRAFHEIYNPYLAAEVLARLISEYPGIQLQMAGPDKDGSLDKTRKISERLGLSKAISFLGPISKKEVPGKLNEADIFLNTSNIDNMPVSVMEAMALGLCIVSTNVGGIPDLLEHEKDALLVPPNDAEAMAKAVRRILTDKELTERLSRNARAKAETFDWKHILPKWEELFSKTIRSHA